ncbi:MAG TPA: HEAT repeat domain-containing protein [Polyangia bacterium]|jgi:HEAT repeat protein|nr:HEAT repeat domain-containing protein [Polyangia bacterium]
MKLRPFFAIGGFLLIAGQARAESPPVDRLPEPTIAAAGAEGDYLRAIHHQVHRRWAENFIRLAGETLPATDRVNDLTRAVEDELVIGADGQIISTKLTTPSGFAGFDDAVGDVLRDSAPFPKPPVDLLSDDDAVHIRWTFARDQRRCSQLALERAQDPLEIAAPKLLRKNRQAELFNRASAAVAAGLPVESVVGAVAKAWMPANLAGAHPSGRVARALAETGDRAAIKWLQAAVTQPATAGEVGEALSAAKVRVCPLVKKTLGGATVAEQEPAARALKNAGEPDCAPELVKLLQNPKARIEARVAAAVALGPITDDAGHKALAAAAKDDPSPAVRGAAMLAGIRPGAGRGKVVAMVAFLRDPAPDVRAAAAGGIIRAGGDTDLADLYVLFKDNDPRAAESVARELDRVRTEEATKFLVRLLKRPQASVQLLAAQMLIKRHAVSSFAALKPFLDPTTEPTLRARALVAADAPVLAAMANPGDGPGNDPNGAGVAAYRAYLGRGERDLAGAWWVGHAAMLSPDNQTETLLDWIATRDGGAPMARGGGTATAQGYHEK